MLKSYSVLVAGIQVPPNTVCITSSHRFVFPTFHPVFGLLLRCIVSAGLGVPGSQANLKVSFLKVSQSGKNVRTFCGNDYRHRVLKLPENTTTLWG